MAWWDERAAMLQASVRSQEIENSDVNFFDDDDVRRSIVFTRQDVILLVSHLSTLNRQLSRGVLLLWAILVAQIIMVVK